MAAGAWTRSRLAIAPASHGQTRRGATRGRILFHGSTAYQSAVKISNGGPEIHASAGRDESRRAHVISGCRRRGRSGRVSTRAFSRDGNDGAFARAEWKATHVDSHPS